MSINFKIFFKELLDKNDKTVLLRGNLLEFEWNKLKEKIIENSHNSYFESKKLALYSENFTLTITEGPQIDELLQNNSIYNDISFYNLITILKKYQEENQNKEIKIKFSLEKNKNEIILKEDKKSHTLILKETLQNIWENEKEKIENELNGAELTRSQIDFFYNNLNKNKNKNNLDEDKKHKIICNNCLSLYIYGYRYTCSYCDNYNLCYKCFKKDIHNKNHNFIIFRKPLLLENDINEYNNKIIPNSFIFKNIKDHFQVDIKIANIGEKDLNNCYIGYIKFDGNYLHCKKNILNIKKNEIININLQIYFNNEESIDLIDFIDFNIFEGHFRMFNEIGIPFGDILKIKVINEYASKI